MTLLAHFTSLLSKTSDLKVLSSPVVKKSPHQKEKNINSLHPARIRIVYGVCPKTTNNEFHFGQRLINNSCT